MTQIVRGIGVKADTEIQEFLAPRFYSSCASCLIIVLIAQKAPSQLARLNRHLKEELPEQCGFWRKLVGNNYLEEVLLSFFEEKQKYVFEAFLLFSHVPRHRQTSRGPAALSH